ncbi:unnamed protein product, partial [Durusdinium trenchii]
MHNIANIRIHPQVFFLSFKSPELCALNAQMAWGNALLVVLLSALPQIAAGNGCTATQIQNDLLPNHATPSSCWTVIVVNRQKVVYDVTKLVSNHEGGRRVIEQMCGRDGSIGFWCWHTLEDLQESIDDGDATEICRTSASVRRLDAREDASGRRLDDDEWDEEDEDDDEGIRNSCAAGGSLPPAPATQILASEVANHKSSGDCWTSMTQGTTNVVMDITNYMTLHPGGKAYILSMCGRDSTAAFQVYHPWTYVTEAVRHGYVSMKGQLSGTYPVITTTTVTLAPGVTTTTGPTSSPQTKITATVLGQHASTSSCWGRIGSWVVDMTQLLSTHPAGNSMLTCGQDVTASFRSIHADSYISRMPVMGTWDDTVIRRPTPTPSPSPATTTAPTPAAPAPSPPQIVGGQTSILNPQVPSESNEMISSTDVAGHNTKADCWLALRCKVYDMTAYVPLHTADKYASAGNGAIERLCGSDATAAFEAVHPISYIDVSVSLGAIYQGLLAGCGAPPATASTTQPPTTTAAATTAPPSPAPSPEMVPVNATLWYELRFPNLVAATQNLGSVQTETSLSVAVANTMAQQGLSNVRCIVSNLRSGSILATVGLFMKDVGQLEHVQFFGRNHMTKVSWLGDSPTVQGTPTLDVAYATSPTPTQASTATTSSLPVYTIDQVRDHNSNVDCWMAIHGKVYSFMGAGGAHPAGNFLSLGICGVEASATFDLHHPLSYLSVSALKKIGGAQVGTLSSASAEDAGRTYPRPSPVQVLPNIVVTLNGGSTDFLQKHNLGQDCWMALHGDVYDATSMLSQHDGGRANVEALCGLDATASFDCVHGMGEIQEAVNDYGISKVGTTTTVLGQGCTFQLQAGMLPDQQITWEELAKHSTTQDCWVILGSQGIVWDITAYLPKHTGGSASVGMHCGGDATSPFDKKHKAGYITTMAQKGGIPQGTISGPQPALDSGTVHLTPLQMSEVAKHSIAADCWVAVHGYVLDVTG